MTTLSATPTWAELDEVDRFEEVVAAWRAGELDDDAFRTKRLHLGVYGIRQSDTHMVRIKVPGGVLAPDHLDAVADVAERWSRGFAHLTTRQNFQVHFVQLDDVAQVLRRLADAGMTTREACGNTIRNITQSHLAGIDPDEVVDTRPAVEVIARYLLRHPAFQALPRKFKIAFDGSAHDHAHLGIHDIGLLGCLGPAGEPGFKLFVGGGLGTAPREADLLEEFTPRERTLATTEAILTVFEEHGERRNRVKARIKFLVQRWGIERFREAVFAERDRLEATTTYPEVPLPVVRRARPEGAPLPEPTAVVTDVVGYTKWRSANVFAHDSNDGVRYAAYGTFPLGDLTAAQLRALAATWRQLGDHVEVRTTIRQNLLFANLRAAEVPQLYATLAAHEMAKGRAEKAGDVVSCPGAETCNLALTASRGLAGAVGDALEAAGLDEVENLKINISGCPNACGQHTTADLGFAGMARRDKEGNEAPGYRVYVGASVGAGGVNFGHYIAKVPALKAPDVAVTLVGRYATERQAGERFSDWVARVTPQTLKADLAPWDSMPSKAEDPTFYADFGLTGPFAVILGKGECAT